MNTPKFTVKKHITLPTLKIAVGDVNYVTVMERFETKKTIEVVKKGGVETEVEKEITVANITNIRTGELMQMVVPTVIMANFKETYGDTDYAGLSFMFEKQEKPEGKKYHSWKIQEIELEQETKK